MPAARLHHFVVFLAMLLGFADPISACAAEFSDVVLVIHGGTARAKGSLTPKREQEMRAVMLRALAAGRDALAGEEATAIDGVVAAICILEDSPLFNAGRGAVFTADERNELDASLMEGSKLQAGAVAGVTIVKNPVLAARAVMERTEHVLLVGHGAEQFCREQKLELVDPSYFRTDERLEELRRVQAEEKAAAERSGKVSDFAPQSSSRTYGTVGAVALDRDGHLVAGTSTGGMTNKRHGRVGDSPIIGAGTYADDRACGVSCTGHGEYFIRFGVARSIVERVRREKQSIEQAAREVIHDDLAPAGGSGGMIVLDRRGHATFAWNTPGMWHGRLTRDGKMHVEVYDE